MWAIQIWLNGVHGDQQDGKRREEDPPLLGNRELALTHFNYQLGTTQKKKKIKIPSRKMVQMNLFVKPK